jgi:type II secretory pathway component PulF
MFTRRIPLPDLIDLCRSLRHQLGAGLSIQRVLSQQSERGRSSIRATAARLGAAIRGGDNLSGAIEREGDTFPPLFLAMTKVGESTGHIAEIFGELERYFELELQLRRQFRSQTFLPILQFVFAVAVMAGVIYIVGMIASMLGGPPLVTLFGLSGGAGALAFLGVVFGSIAAIWLIYAIVSRLGRQKVWMDWLLLNLPAIGPCAYAVTMSRFTLALQLTLDSGVPVAKALKLSFEATGNAFFKSRSDVAVQTVKSGKSLYKALTDCQLFDDQFLEMVITSEESGSVPEMMRHLVQQYQDDTARKLKIATGLASGAVWFCVAAFIVWGIFKLAGVYLGALEKI